MSWRTFKFFEFEELKDPDTNQPYDKLKVCTVCKIYIFLVLYSAHLARIVYIFLQDFGITCCICGRGQMIFGDILHCLL